MGMLGLGTHTVKGAVRGVGQVTHLVGEMVLGTAPHFSIDGTLILTNYRIIWQALSTKDAMEIPLASILSAESSTTAPHVANIEGKHLLRASLAFQDENTCSEFLSCIWELYSTGGSPPHFLFAHLHYQALRHKEEVKSVTGTGLRRRMTSSMTQRKTIGGLSYWMKIAGCGYTTTRTTPCSRHTRRLL